MLDLTLGALEPNLLPGGCTFREGLGPMAKFPAEGIATFQSSETTVLGPGIGRAGDASPDLRDDLDERPERLRVAPTKFKY